MEPGRYEIDGDNIYILVQDSLSKPQDTGKWEAHKRYIDIQYVVKGTGYMGNAYADDLKVTKEYEADSDYYLREGAGSMIFCSKGTFIIFAPADAHMPSMATDLPEQMKKIVAKVKI